MQTPLYDLSKLEAISKGNKQFTNKMIQIFIDQTPKSVYELKEAYEKGNYEKVKALAHRIKPSVNTMGIDTLKNDLSEIEDSILLLKSSKQMDKLIYKLETVINNVVVSLKQLLN